MSLHVQIQWKTEEIMIKFRQTRIVDTYFFDDTPHVNRCWRRSAIVVVVVATVDECRELFGQLLTVFAAQGSSRTSHHETKRNECVLVVLWRLGGLLECRGGVTQCDTTTTTTTRTAAVEKGGATKLHRLQGRLVQRGWELLQTCS